MSKFKDKFHLLPEQNLFLAKKKLDENIYCGMKMKKLKQFCGFNCLNILSINYLLSGAKVGSFFIKKIYMNTVLHRKYYG